MENGLGLSTVTGLFTVITAFSLSGDAVLTLLVLGDLVESVLPALLALAVGLLRLRNVHLQKRFQKIITVRRNRREFKEEEEEEEKLTIVAGIGGAKAEAVFLGFNGFCELGLVKCSFSSLSLLSVGLFSAMKLSP